MSEVETGFESEPAGDAQEIGGGVLVTGLERAWEDSPDEELPDAFALEERKKELEADVLGQQPTITEINAMSDEGFREHLDLRAAGHYDELDARAEAQRVHELRTSELAYGGAIQGMSDEQFLRLLEHRDAVGSGDETPDDFGRGA